MSAGVASRSTIVLAGGGTGGHISPGLAIAESLREREPNIRVVFACSTRAIDRQMLERAGEEFVAVPAEPISLRPFRLWRFLRTASAARRTSRAVVRDGSPSWVVALGGFVSVPVTLAARSAGVSTLLFNLDAVPGRANRFLARRCTRLLSAVAAPQLGTRAGEGVGFPVRAIARCGVTQAQARSALGLEPQLRTLLVTGASQGAGSVNDLALALAATKARALDGWQVLHLCGGSADVTAIRAAYSASSVSAVVLPFLHEMGLAWGAADLAVTRGGANSAGEAQFNRVPAVFLPYPWHRDQHQRANVEHLVGAGAARCCTDHIEAKSNLAEAGVELLRLIADSKALARMKAALQAMPRADGAQAVVNVLLGPREAPGFLSTAG